MEQKPLKIGDLIVQKPVFQGGMGIGISLGNLAGAVAKEGGAGTISAAQIGYLEDDFDENPFEANMRAMEKELKKARAIAPDGVIGFNIMAAMRHYEEYVKRAAELGADFIVSGAGLPVELPHLIKDYPVKIAPIVSTEKSADVILHYWWKKYKRLSDFIVIEGPKAGGHLGFTKEQLVEFDEKNYEAEVKRIIHRVKTYETEYDVRIPVVLAGGIDSKTQAERAFVLGADAVQAATRFVTTVECDGAEEFKMAYINAAKEDIVIVRSPVGMPGRAILNPFLQKIQNGIRVVPKKCRGCLRKCNPQEIPYCITEALIHAAKGETSDALLFCGANAYKADKIESVKEVIDSLLG